MLAVAGNETTRNSITHGMIAFANNPDQWELYKKERPSTAADEIIRWATPVSAFQRTANEDVELAGVQIKKGQRVVMSYRSANFDEEVFEDPHSFNILRDPNPARRLRRHRRALLHRRQPGPDDDQPDLQRGRRSHAGPQADLGARAAAVGLAQRHQALAGRLHRQCARWRPDGFHARTATQQAVADVVTSVLDRDNSWEALVSRRRDGTAGARTAGR